MSKFKTEVINSAVIMSNFRNPNIWMIHLLCTNSGDLIVDTLLNKESEFRVIEDFKSGVLEELYNNLPESAFDERYRGLL